jgi:hypothetical protein
MRSAMRSVVMRLRWDSTVSSQFSADRLWLVHLRQFCATGQGDYARHLRAVLAGTIVSDALRCGVNSIEAVLTEDGWILLGCETEWLQLDLPQPMASRELFTRLVYWAGDSLRTRHEFHIATASSDVFLSRSGTLEIIKGAAPPPTTREAASAYAFALGYKLPHG